MGMLKTKSSLGSRHWPSAALGLLLLAGCGSVPSQGGRVDSGTVDSLSPEERRLQAVETKLTQVQRRLDALNTLRFEDENTRLRDDMRALRGEIEKARFDLQQSDRRSKELYMDMDRRLQSIETRGVSATPAPAPSTAYAPSYTTPAPSYPQTQTYPPPAPQPSLPVMQAPPVSSGGAAVISQDVGSPEEEGAYLASFDLLKSGKYDEAVRGFKGVLDKWPRGRYADNAAYWMGEASYVKRDYSSALSAFQMVVNNYPSSPKVADAALKAGLTQIELKQTDAAKATLQSVVRKYPSSNAAKLAQQKLSSLGGAPADTDSDRPRR